MHSIRNSRLLITFLDRAHKHQLWDFFNSYRCSERASCACGAPRCMKIARDRKSLMIQDETRHFHGSYRNSSCYSTMKGLQTLLLRRLVISVQPEKASIYCSGLSVDDAAVLWL